MPRWMSPHFSENSYFSRAAVASEHARCSEFGRDLMIEGGNAIEAAILVLICIGVVQPEKSGLGGGHFMTVYNAKTRKCSAVDARDVAPSAATENMYNSKPSSSLEGWLAIPVAGELHGLRTAYETFGGNVPWSRLFEPSIKLLDQGIPVSQELDLILKHERQRIIKEPTFRDFINPKTGDVYRCGEIMEGREQFRKTLRTLADAEDPIKEFYNGNLTLQFVDEIKKNGGILTLDDFKNYKAILRNESEIMKTKLRGRYVCGPPPPASSALTQSILRVLDTFALKRNESGSASEIDFLHMFLEATKFAFAKRGLLSDMDFNKNAFDIAKYINSDAYVKKVYRKISRSKNVVGNYGIKIAPSRDRGTSNVAVIDRFGNVAVATTSINYYFGAGVASSSSGIIWSSTMDDFSKPNAPNFFGFPPSAANFIRPGKRPMTSASPLIVISKKTGGVELAIGSAGGSKIISTVAFVAHKVLSANYELRKAVAAPRLHNQLLPNVTLREDLFPANQLEALASRGHVFSVGPLQGGVTAIYVQNNKIYAAGDFRRGVESQPAGY